MAFDVTLGQYYGTNSVIHKMDPRSKLLFVLFFIVSIFVAKDIYSFALLFGIAIFSVIVSKVPIRAVLKGLKPLIFIIVFTSLLNMFLTRGDELIFSKEIIKGLWTINLYKEGLINAALLTVRIITLLIGTSVYFSYATTPIELTDGIERGLGFLKKIKVPIHEFAMMMTIALRFIPTLIDETSKIMNAQKARGADFSSGGLIKRAKALIPIIIPLFVSSFRRAEELATAMECRCYHGGDGRTRMKVRHVRFVDFIPLILIVIFGASLIVLNIVGIGFTM